MPCFAEDVARLAAVARTICPFPRYTPHLYFDNMLDNINSSHHLKEHYTAVQSSLTPKQLEDFTQALRTTFGKEGKVTLGGVGVVALSLAVLFDTLAKTVKGEQVSESEPIPGLFIKNPSGYYPPHVYTMSKYLRQVPHIANNPTRMKQETERYIKHLEADTQVFNQMGENSRILVNEDVTMINSLLGEYFSFSLTVHLARINNGSTDVFARLKQSQITRNDDTIININCDPEKDNKEFLAEVEKSDNKTKEASQKCGGIYFNTGKPTSLFNHIAELELSVAFSFFLPHALKMQTTEDFPIHRGDFDLKANALGKWA